MYFLADFPPTERVPWLVSGRTSGLRREAEVKYSVSNLGKKLAIPILFYSNQMTFKLPSEEQGNCQCLFFFQSLREVFRVSATRCAILRHRLSKYENKSEIRCQRPTSCLLYLFFHQKSLAVLIFYNGGTFNIFLDQSVSRDQINKPRTWRYLLIFNKVTESSWKLLTLKHMVPHLKEKKCLCSLQLCKQKCNKALIAEH